MKLGVIGAGNMASAILRAIADSEKSSAITRLVYEIDPDKAEATRAWGCTPCETMNEPANADFLLIAVKPQAVPTVLETLAPCYRFGTVIVSIAAGISSDCYTAVLGDDTPVVTVMPNTPLMLKKGATALAKNDAVSDEAFQTVCDIFALSGVIGVLPENKMKEIIAINGSSPAFIYLFAKSFLDYAAEVGIDPDTARTLFCGTLNGAAEMLTSAGKPVDELIRAVCSPGGTTLAGMDALYAGRLPETVRAACEACTKRAYELSE